MMDCNVLFCCLGAGRVGKTSLLVRFIHDTFAGDQAATVQASFVSKRVQIDNQQVSTPFSPGIKPSKATGRGYRIFFVLGWTLLGVSGVRS
jgi:GTPase SAR1 family protein